MADFPTADELVRALGVEIAFMRKRRKLTRQELAEKAGISETTMGRIEREGPVDISATWRIADALSVPLSMLVISVEKMMARSPSGRTIQEIRAQLAEIDAWFEGVEKRDRSFFWRRYRKSSSLVEAEERMASLRRSLEYELAAVMDVEPSLDRVRLEEEIARYNERVKAEQESADAEYLKYGNVSPEELLAALKGRDVDPNIVTTIAMVRYFEEHDLYQPFVDVLTQDFGFRMLESPKAFEGD